MSSPYPDGLRGRVSRWQDRRRGTKKLKATATRMQRDLRRADKSYLEQVGRARMTPADLQAMAQGNMLGQFDAGQQAAGQTASANAASQLQAAGPRPSRTLNPARALANGVSRRRNIRRGRKALKAAYAQMYKDAKRMRPDIREAVGRSDLTPADLQQLAQGYIDQVFNPGSVAAQAVAAQQAQAQQAAPQAQQAAPQAQPQAVPTQDQITQIQADIARLDAEQVQLRDRQTQILAQQAALQAQLAQLQGQNPQPQQTQPAQAQGQQGPAQPAPAAAAPAQGTAQPTPGTAQPAPGTAQPAPGTAQPAPGTAQPAQGTAQPAPAAAQPAAPAHVPAAPPAMYGIAPDGTFPGPAQAQPVAAGPQGPDPALEQDPTDAWNKVAAGQGTPELGELAEPEAAEPAAQAPPERVAALAEWAAADQQSTALPGVTGVDSGPQPQADMKGEPVSRAQANATAGPATNARQWAPDQMVGPHVDGKPQSQEATKKGALTKSVSVALYDLPNASRAVEGKVGKPGEAVDPRPGTGSHRGSPETRTSTHRKPPGGAEI
jgi:hypothetical protein